MRTILATLAFTVAIATLPLITSASSTNADAGKHHDERDADHLQLGPRPFFLVHDMNPSALKTKLESCENGPFYRTDFSIGHRGAAMQFPEHTRESYEAAARMGAGIIECDVTFTKDKELVCRHSQCDLHTTTNILATPLAAKCSKPFTPAEFDLTGKLVKPASAMCCASDITQAEFKTLRGKMDGANANARTVVEYLNGTPSWRTDLYSGPSSGTLVTHPEYIQLIKKLGAKYTPELKSASVPMPFDGFTQQAYAQKMIDQYKDAGVPARKVFAQSFDLQDILYWIKHEPEFGMQAVYLDDIDPTDDNPANDTPKSLAQLQALAAQGVKIIAPPMWALLEVNAKGAIVPSQYALDAKAAGLDIITWTLERSGILADGDGGWYYQTVNSTLNKEGDMLAVLNVLAKDVGIRGIFSDWPATVTYYASCMGLK